MPCTTHGLRGGLYDILRILQDGVQEIAGLLGTDEAGAREVVGTTAQEDPLQGVATLGRFATGGLMAGVLAKAAKPVANAVAKKTGAAAGDRHTGRRDADPGGTRGAHEAGGEEEVKKKRRGSRAKK